MLIIVLEVQLNLSSLHKTIST